MNIKVNSWNGARIKALFFANGTRRQTIMKNAFWLGFGNIASRLVKGLLIIYAARRLGTEGYGVFSYALSLAGLLSMFADFGTTAIVTREVAKVPERLRTYLSTGLVVKFCILIVNIALILTVAPFVTKIPGAIPLIPIAALLVAFDSLRDFTFAHARAREKMEQEGIINVATNAAITALGLATIMVLPTPRALLLAYVAGAGIGLAVALWYVRAAIARFWHAFDRDVARHLIRDGWPFALFGLLNLVMLNTDTVVLGWFKDATEVGLYAAAQRPIQLLQLLPTIVSTSLFPIFSQLAHRDDRRLGEILGVSLAGSLAFALPAVTGGVILAPGIIRLLYGPAYAGAATAFAILVATLAVTFANVLLANAIFAYNKQKFFVKFAAVGAIVNLAGDLLFIPMFGGAGSAAVTLTAQTIAIVLSWHVLKSTTPFSVIPRLWRPLLATAIMGMSVALLGTTGIPVLGAIALGAAVYVAALFALREPLLNLLAVRGLLNPAAAESSAQNPLS